MCDCFKSRKFIYFMIAIILVSNIILFIWNKWWRSQLEHFGGTSTEILQMKNDLQSIDDQLQEYDTSLRDYVTTMDLKSEDDVVATEAEVQNDNAMMESMNNNIMNLGGLIEQDSYLKLTSNLDFNLDKLEDTTEELKDTNIIFVFKMIQNKFFSFFVDDIVGNFPTK